MARKNMFYYPLVMVAVVTAACIPLVLIGVQSGHSFGLNVSWAAGFMGQFLGGELYPRWLIDLNEGAGSPVFFFYGPLPFYLMASTALLCPGCGVNVVLGITGWLIIALSGLTFYVFARQHAEPRISMIGAVFYALAPYHFVVDFMVRQALGEVTAFIWMPLILYFVRKIQSDRYSVIGFAFSYSLLILSHLPSALLFSMFLLLYAALLAYQNRSPSQFYVFLSGVLLGVALAGIYIVPAVFSQDYISANQWWSLKYEYHRWFFLDGGVAPNPQFSDGLFILLSLTTLVFFRVWYVAFRRHEAKERTSLYVWLLFVAGAWFLMTPVSWPLWELFPLLKKVQFPWRVAIVLDLAVAMAFVMAMRDVSADMNRKFVSISIMAGLLLTLSGGYGVVYYANSWLQSQSAQHQEKLQSYISSGYDASEYIPASVSLSRVDILDYLKTAPRVALDGDRGEIDILQWEARKLAFNVDLSDETRLTVRQFYYPGWHASTGDGVAAPKIVPSEQTGLLELVAPPGRYRLELTMGWLPQELAGAALSASGLLILSLLAAVRFLRRRQYRFPFRLGRLNAISTVGRR
jgi:hypothetical protein